MEYNKQPILYVNIWDENKPYGITSEEDVFFEFTKDHTTKIVVFSAIGYKIKNYTMGFNI